MRSPLLLLVRVVFGALALVVLAVALLAFVPPPTTSFMILASIGRREMVSYDWEPDGNVSSNLLVAAVAAEDQRFAEHDGFDFEAIEKAAEHNRRGGSIRGASTISQQVAKNLFLWPGRSWVRKGLEAGITVVIEKLWTRRRILDVYVNVAEFGDGVFGAEAAARKYFGKPAAALSAADAALLAAVLPDPHRYRVDAPSAYVRRRQQWILRQMQALSGAAYLKKL